MAQVLILILYLICAGKFNNYLHVWPSTGAHRRKIGVDLTSEYGDKITLVARAKETE